MSLQRSRRTKRKILDHLLWAATAILLVFYFLRVREYRNSDIVYVLFAVIASGTSVVLFPSKKRREQIFLLWLFLFSEFFLRATVYGRADFFEYMIIEADERRIEWFLADKVNLVPFRTIGLFTKIVAESKHAFINLVGNVVLLIPCAFLLPLAFPKTAKAFRGSSFWLPLLFVFCLSLAAELLQFFFMCGFPDVDDLILNTLGGGIGAALALSVTLLRATSRKERDLPPR